MFLSEFLSDVEERYYYPSVDDSVELARNAAFCIVDLIRRGFDVSEFLELIYTESCYFEYNRGLNFRRYEQQEISF